MMQSAFATHLPGSEANRPPPSSSYWPCDAAIADAGLIPNAAIFIKETPRPLRSSPTAPCAPLRPQTLHRCLQDQRRGLPRAAWPGYTEAGTGAFWSRVLCCKTSLNCTCTAPANLLCLTPVALYNHAGAIIGLAGISVDLQTASESHPAYQRLAAVDAHIRAHFNLRVTLGELTRIAGISVAQLERYCKRVFHLTPRQMIQKVRLEHAHRLLHTDMPITEVALQCGYTDHSAFTRQFKAATGFTPRQYRETR